MASWLPSIVHPTASIGAVSLILSIPSDSTGQEGAKAGSSWYIRTRKLPRFKRFLKHLFVPSLLRRVGSPSPPHPIRVAPAEPPSAAPCFQIAAGSGEFWPELGNGRRCPVKSLLYGAWGTPEPETVCHPHDDYGKDHACRSRRPAHFSESPGGRVECQIGTQTEKTAYPGRSAHTNGYITQRVLQTKLWA